MNKKQGDVKSFFRLKEPLWAVWGNKRQYIVSNAQPDVLSHLYLDLCLHCNTLIIETTEKYSAVCTKLYIVCGQCMQLLLCYRFQGTFSILMRIEFKTTPLFRLAAFDFEKQACESLLISGLLMCNLIFKGWVHIVLRRSGHPF